MDEKRKRVTAPRIAAALSALLAGAALYTVSGSERQGIQVKEYKMCIRDRGENSVLEYAFQLQVVTEGLVPETIKPIVDVTNLSISVWNTDLSLIHILCCTGD